MYFSKLLDFDLSTTKFVFSRKWLKKNPLSYHLNTPLGGLQKGIVNQYYVLMGPYGGEPLWFNQGVGPLRYGKTSVSSVVFFRIYGKDWDMVRIRLELGLG